MPWAGIRFVDRRGAVRLHPVGRDRPKGTRDIARIDSIVLHQMGFSRGNDITAYDGVGVHYCVLPDGTITQNHDPETYLWASNGLNSRSVAVEFAGNFPSVRGRAHNEARFGRHIPPLPQIFGGRTLLKTLKEGPGIRLQYVFGHVQASWPNKGNCPGPHIWYNVGEWGLRQLGLSDGGRGFHVAGGHPIPDRWRDSEWDLTLEDLMGA
jgi:hypothetical protein